MSCWRDVYSDSQHDHWILAGNIYFVLTKQRRPSGRRFYCAPSMGAILEVRAELDHVHCPLRPAGRAASLITTTARTARCGSAGRGVWEGSVRYPDRSYPDSKKSAPGEDGGADLRRSQWQVINFMRHDLTICNSR